MLLCPELASSRCWFFAHATRSRDAGTVANAILSLLPDTLYIVSTNALSGFSKSIIRSAVKKLAPANGLFPPGAIILYRFSLQLVRIGVLMPYHVFCRYYPLRPINVAGFECQAND